MATLRVSLVVVALLAATVADAAPAPAGDRTPAATSQPTASPSRPAVDRTTLPRLLAARGFRPNSRFKALIIEIKRTRKRGLSFRHYDYRGTSTHRDNWWPASTVKLFAAVAALSRVRAEGFSPRARATFQYDDAPYVTSIARLVQLALTPSNNWAFDRLVEIAGFDALNRDFFTAKSGLPTTVLLRAYGARRRSADGHGDNRHSPPIVLREGSREKTLPERTGTGTYPCPEQGNCTTLAELSEALRRVMLHDELPAAERYPVGRTELRLMRRSLAGKRSRGNGVIDGLRAGFGDGVALRIHSKPGYASKWFSDHAFVHRPDTGQRWIVALAGHGGRDVLDKAARHVGALLSTRRSLLQQRRALRRTERRRR